MNRKKRSSRQRISDLELIALYLTLKELRRQYSDFKMPPAYHRNKKEDSCYHKYFSTPSLCAPNLELFVFLVLFSHNTTDTHTLRTLKKIDEILESGMEPDYLNLFYKKKHLYFRCMKDVVSLIRSKDSDNKELLLTDLVEVPYISHKSATIILNHLYDKVHPIVDVNVHKAFNILTSRSDTAYEVYTSLSRMPELMSEDHSAYVLANWLWGFRKYCRSVHPICASKKNDFKACRVCNTARDKYIFELRRLTRENEY